MRVVDNIYELVGNTPVVKLNKLVTEDMADVYVKLESFNPGSSIKDRIALSMINSAEKEGLIKPGDTIIEPTSGNTGIGLAMIAASKGYKMVLVMPDTMSIERRKILESYGAELILTPGAMGMKGSINKAKELSDKNEWFMPQQFENPNNPLVHERTTGPEIIRQMPTLDAFVSGIGTGGTITGTSKVLKENYEDILIVAVEPDDSAVLSGEKPGPHKIQGIGAGFIPNVLNTDVFDQIERVTNDDAINTSRALAINEGILAGISSGAAVHAALNIAKKLGNGKKVLAILPDTGERYLSTTIFNDQ